MTERELKLLMDANAIKRIQLHYAVMSQGYMVIADGKPLETNKRKTREFKSLDGAAKFLMKIGVADFTVKLQTNMS